MGLLTGKKGLIVGVANERSIGWGIAQACHREGAKLGFTFVNEALEKRVVPLAQSVDSDLIVKLDVQSDSETEEAFKTVESQWGSLDFLVHSVAFAHGDDLKGRISDTSREGFKLALDVSAYSLLSLSRYARPLMKNGGSIVCLSYLGAEKVVPNYRLMGIAKAALEAATRELSADLGPEGIRVNAISAGPIKTLAASGISNFKALLSAFEERAPLRHCVTTEEVGDVGVYFVSELSRAVTGEVHYVDCGFNITAL